MRRLRLGVLGDFGSGDAGRDAALLAFLQWIRRHAVHVEPIGLFDRPDGRTHELGIDIDPTAARLNARFIASASPRRADISDPSITLAGEDSGRMLPTASAGGNAARAHRLASVSRVSRSARIALALLRAFPDQVRCVRGLSGIVVLGSGLDARSPSVLRALRAWTWALACRWTGQPFVMLSAAVEVSPHAISRALDRATLRMAAYVSVCDADALRAARALGLSGAIARSPNPVFGLIAERRWRMAHDRPQQLATATPPLVIGISPAACDRAADKAAYDRYIGALAQFCAHIVRAGRRVVLFATDADRDRRAMLDLLARVPADALHGIRMEEAATVGDAARCISAVDTVVASRLQAVLLALWGTRPVISAGFDDAGARLLREVELTGDAFPADTLDAQVLIEAEAATSRRYDERRERLHTVLARLRAQLDACYRDAFTRAGWEDAVTMPLPLDGAAPVGSTGG